MAKSTTEKAAPTLESLAKDLQAKQTDLLDAKRSLAAGDLVNPRVITTTRRDIARIKTHMRALELGEKETN